MPDTNGSQLTISSPTTNVYQNYPKIASFSDGRSVITWDLRPEIQSDLANGFLQQIDVSGQKFGNERRLNLPNKYNGHNPSVVVLSNGGFLVTWGFNDGIYGSIYTSQGYSGNLFTVNSTGIGPVQSLALPDGNAVIIFNSTSADVYAQLIDIYHNLIGSVFKVNTIGAANYTGFRYASVGLLNNSQFITSWLDYDSSTTTKGLYAQIFNLDGTKVGSQFKVNTESTVGDTLQQGSFIARLNNGNIVIFWRSDAAERKFYYQVLDSSGTKIGNELTYNPVTTGAWDYQFSVTPLGNGFLFFHTDFISASDLDVNAYGQLFDASGNKIGTRFLVNTDTSNSQYHPSAAVSSTGDFAVVWRNSEKDIDNNNIETIKFQRFYGTLTATNTNQTISYTEDDSNISFNNINVLSPTDILNVSLTLSDPTAGRLTTATLSGLSSTYIAATGTWQASGNKASVNALLADVQFVPAANANNNFNIALTIDDTFSTPINGTIFAVSTPVNDIPILVNNQLNISQGQTLLLTSTNLSATDVDNAASTLSFTVSNVQNGRFQLISNPGIAITTFKQQQISDGQVQFVHNGSSLAPSYQVTVSDGFLTTTPAVPIITYNVATPVLVNNLLTVNQGQMQVLTSTNLSATDADTASGSLTFTISNVQNGRFELLSNPGVAITSFVQQQITDGQVRFVHDNSVTKPAFQVSVSDGYLVTTPQSASVLFNITPVLGNNQLVINEGQTIVLTTDNFSATDGDNGLLSFIVSSVTHGRFEFTSNPGISITTFTQQQIINGRVRFVHDGSEIAPTYKVSVSDGSASTLAADGQISFTNVNDMPVLVNNQLSINPGETHILTSSNLSATDVDNIPNTLVFTVSNVQHGQFEITADPGIALTSFTQQQVITGQIQFVHDGSNLAPTYLVSVSDGNLDTTPVAATIQFMITPVAIPVTVEPTTSSPNTNSPQTTTVPQDKVSNAASLSAGWISPATWLNIAHQTVHINLIEVAKLAGYEESKGTTQPNVEQTALPSIATVVNNVPSQLMLWQVGMHWGQQAWQWLTQSSQTPSTDHTVKVEPNKLMQEIRELKASLAQAERYQAVLYAKNPILAEPFDFALESHIETLNDLTQQGKADVATLSALKEDVAYLLNVLKVEYKAQKASANDVSQVRFFTTPINTAKQSTNVNELAITTNNNLLTNGQPQVTHLLAK